MKTVCAASVYRGVEAFSTLGETTVVADGEITADTVRDADALIVRSKTRVNEELLDGSRVSFVGSTVAGADHMDLDYLDALEIGWFTAAGCNANSVSEYVVAALLVLSRRLGLPLESLTLGVVGVGHVGSKVVEKGRALGMRVLRNDPPKYETTGDPVYLPLEDVLREADVLTLHVPLVKTRPFPTRYMANHRFFESTKPGCLFINSSRGEVVSEEALANALEHGAVAAAALDVWDGEPRYDRGLLDMVELGTPHIAGHSIEGKLEGTWSVYHDACQFFEVEPSWKPCQLPGGRGASAIKVDATGQTDEEVLAEIVGQVYDIEEDDREMRAGAVADDEERARHFKRSRAEYPIRREFAAAQVTLQQAQPSLSQKAANLGFSLLEP